MTNNAKAYSQRLGAIRDDQFEAVAERFSLGRFLRAEPISQGLFGQNVFLNTSEGAFVLRGAPHWVRRGDEVAWRQQDQWQFTKERYFAEALHRHTNAPVPWPMHYDASTDIFGWPYLVMPRMPGECFEDRDLRRLPETDQRSIAQALGVCLADMQRLEAPEAGDVDVDSLHFTPYPKGETRFIIEQTRGFIQQATQNGSLTPDDIDWMESVFRDASGIPPPRPTYVHVDFKLGNLCVEKTNGAYRVSGLFDFHEGRFGSGALDLVRQSCSFIDHSIDLAHLFVQSFITHTGDDPRVAPLMRLFVINDRMKIWGYFTQPGVKSALPVAEGFRLWVERYFAANVFW